MKGILLAGGNGERLFPITRATSKQLLPVYDKPMIFYPLCTLMQAGIRDILIIVRPEEENRFRALLADGSQWGLDLSYATQSQPNGIAEAPLIGADFLDGDGFVLALGDNIFCGEAFEPQLANAVAASAGASIFVKEMEAAERYGVIAFDDDGAPQRIIEKPSEPPSRYAVAGLYIYDGGAVEIARQLTPSSRGELEITDLNNAYLEAGRLTLETLPESVAWLDMGTPDGLLDASRLVAAEQARRGERIGVPEHVAMTNGWIDAAAVARLAEAYGDNDYGGYLTRLVGDG